MTHDNGAYAVIREHTTGEDDRERSQAVTPTEAIISKLVEDSRREGGPVGTIIDWDGQRVGIIVGTHPLHFDAFRGLVAPPSDPPESHLGHATVSFTMDTYAHLFEEQRESQTTMINEAFRDAR